MENNVIACFVEQWAENGKLDMKPTDEVQQQMFKYFREPRKRKQKADQTNKNEKRKRNVNHAFWKSCSERKQQKRLQNGNANKGVYPPPKQKRKKNENA